MINHQALFRPLGRPLLFFPMCTKCKFGHTSYLGPMILSFYLFVIVAIMISWLWARDKDRGSGKGRGVTSSGRSSLPPRWSHKSHPALSVSHPLQPIQANTPNPQCCPETNHKLQIQEAFLRNSLRHVGGVLPSQCSLTCSPQLTDWTLSFLWKTEKVAGPLASMGGF